MSTRSVVVIALAIVLAISALCVWLAPSFQDFMAGNTMWNGVRTFLNDSNAIQTTSLAPLPADPRGTVFVTIPYLDYSTDDLAKVKEFLSGGGTVLLADDFGYGNHLLDYLGVAPRFDGGPLLDPLFCYQNQWMPKITDFSSPHGFQVVILNHATALQNVESANIVAWSSATSYIDVNRSEVWNQDELRGPFPVAAKLSYGQGTLVLASDPSLMINSMINHSDNSAFVSYLLGLGGDYSKVYFDISHLSATPLDYSKAGLGRFKALLGTPYPLLALMAAVIAVLARWMLQTGGSIERQPTNR
jgi:hypothetical protein